MAFYEQLFPPRISTNMEGGPRYLADQAFTQSGQRAFNLSDADPIREYNLAHPIKSGSDFEEVRNFFMATRGVDPFLFKDWSDYIATQANTSLSLISGSTYQMNRLYVAPSRTVVRPIYKPAQTSTGAPAVQIWRTRSAVVTDITGTSSINFTTGQVTVAGHMSGDTYTWSGHFYIPAYFSDPMAMFRVLGGPRMLTDWPDISIRESREIA